MCEARTKTFAIFISLAIDLGLHWRDMTNAWIAPTPVNFNAALVI
jgi:hypothetical protein